MPTPEELAAAEKVKAEAEAAAKAAEAEAEKIKAEAEKKEPADEKPEEPFDKDRAMSTIHNLREKENQWKKDQKRLKDLEEAEEKRKMAEMTESEKAIARAEKAEKEAAALRDSVLRRDVIAEVGLPATFADRLKGITKEELLEDAKKLQKEIPSLKQAPKIGPTNPNQGNVNETPEQQRERLFGKQGSPFDLKSIEEGGGGVVWKTPHPGG